MPRFADLTTLRETSHRAVAVTRRQDRQDPERVREAFGVRLEGCGSGENRSTST